MPCAEAPAETRQRPAFSVKTGAQVAARDRSLAVRPGNVSSSTRGQQRRAAGTTVTHQLSVVSCAWRSNPRTSPKRLPDSRTWAADATCRAGKPAQCRRPSSGTLRCDGSERHSAAAGGRDPGGALREPPRPHGGNPARADRRRPSQTKVRPVAPEGPGNPRQPRNCPGSVTSEALRSWWRSLKASSNSEPGLSITIRSPAWQKPSQNELLISVRAKQ